MHTGLHKENTAQRLEDAHLIKRVAEYLQLNLTMQLNTGQRAVDFVPRHFHLNCCASNTDKETITVTKG